MTTTFTQSNTKVGMVFAIADFDHDGNPYPGSLYEVTQVVAAGPDINGNPLRSYCHVECVDYGDSDDESILSFPFDGWLQQ